MDDWSGTYGNMNEDENWWTRGWRDIGIRMTQQGLVG